MTNSKLLYKPGQDNLRPGKYVEVGPRGGHLTKPRTVAIDQGDRLPPTQTEGHRWTRK